MPVPGNSYLWNIYVGQRRKSTYHLLVPQRMPDARDHRGPLAAAILFAFGLAMWEFIPYPLTGGRGRGPSWRE